MDENISIKESTLEMSSINALTSNVINNQPTINIGIIGHVAHGKSTIVKALTGVQTSKHSSEMKRNITMKLGYANAKIYQCNRCPIPNCYKSYGSEMTGELKCKDERCDGKLNLIRHISFVDCPGHEILMATMLSGVSVMDAAILVIAANEKCPQPQTEEHLAAIELTSLKKIIIIQTKIDLVSHKEAVESYKQIMDFIQGTKAEGSPIIPISAQLGFNMDVVCEQMVKHIPVPHCSSFLEPPRMFVIRSFDINKPGTEVDDLKGGVAGGSLTQGIFSLGDKVEVKPGIISQQKDGSFKCTTIYTEVKSLSSDTNNLQFSVPGGLIGVGTNIDPILCRADNLVGQLIGKVGTLPEVYVEIEICFFLLNKLLGVGEGENKKAKINRLRKGETLVLNVGSTNTKGLVKAVCKDLAIISLHCPVCCEVNEKIAISREFDRHWRLIGWGAVLCGTTVESEIDL